MKSNLTDEDRGEIANVVSDFMTGNYLLRPRKLSHRIMMTYISRLLTDGPGTFVDQEIIDYYNACGTRDLMKAYEEKYEIHRTQEI